MTTIEKINRVASIGSWMANYPDSPQIEGVKRYHTKLLALTYENELLTINTNK